MNDHGDAIVAFDPAHLDEPARDVHTDEHRETLVLLAHPDRVLVRVHDRFVAYVMTDAASLTPMNVGDCHEPRGRSDRAAWRWLAPATIEEHRQVERAATNLACAMFDYQHNAGRRGSTLSKFPCDRWGRHGNVWGRGGRHVHRA